MISNNRVSTIRDSMTCNGCEVSVVQSVINFQNRKNTIEFLQNHGVILMTVRCTTCGEVASLNEDELLWRCQRRHREKKGKKIIVSRCNFKQSVRSNTWLQNSNLSLEKACMLIALYITHNSPHQQFLMDELKLTSMTICDWCSFIREVLEHWCTNNSASQLGGPGKIVEIDEAKFGKRKYNRGRIVDGVWLFGGFERDSNNIFVKMVPNRNSKTLLEVIKRLIKPGSIIMSDCWKAYNCLQDEGIYSIHYQYYKEKL